MALPLSRRQFLALSAAGACGAGAYGLSRAVLKVRDAAGRMTSQ